MARDEFNPMPRQASCKVAVLDIDGTLLTPSLQVSNRVRGALQQCQRRGVKIVLATGRSPASVLVVRAQTGVGHFAICSNGSTFLDFETGELSALATISPSTAEVAVREIVNCGAAVCCYSPTDWIGLGERSALQIEEDRSKTAALIVHDDLVEFLVSMPDSVVKLLAICRSASMARELMHRLRGITKIHASSSYPEYVEVAPAGISKASCFRRISNDLGLPVSDFLAVGDAENDISMLNIAGTAVCMGCCSNDVLDASHWQTLSNTEDGLAVALEGLVLGVAQSRRQLIDLSLRRAVSRATEEE